ncbi:hypothetical protein [Gemmata sp. SH-PL17]|uniref:hypothetical protein n=1 Tax=Gemmata sp. SH-PL17 TaxID=1630693 RepID=UPI0012F7E2C7|nr:hypothetical protein [Gemmata sp. SH-PL17]
MVSELPPPAARRLRLFGVACARQVAHLFADGDQTALQVSERFADGLASQAELMALSRPLLDGAPGLGPLVSDSVGWAVLVFSGTHPAKDPDNLHMWQPFEAALFAARALAKEAGQIEAFTAARAKQVELIQDLAPRGHALRILSVWLTPDVLALARGIYEDQDFSAMPILADALQDAGCDNDDILSHCRGPGPHVRGCWVVDSVLGKE